MSDIGISLNANPDDISENAGATAIGDPPVSITGAMADYVNRPLPPPNSLSVLMTNQERADAGVPITVTNGAELGKSVAPLATPQDTGIPVSPPGVSVDKNMADAQGALSGLTRTSPDEAPDAASWSPQSTGADPWTTLTPGPSPWTLER